MAICRLKRVAADLKALLGEGFDTLFVGSGAPRGRELDISGRQEAKGKINAGLH